MQLLPVIPALPSPGTVPDAAWRTGTILEAVVTAVTDRQQATLNIGNRQISVTTTGPLAVGQKLTLEVAGTPQAPVLKPITPPQATPPSAVTEQVRTDLPRQQPLVNLLQTIRDLGPQLGQLRLPPAQQSALLALQQSVVRLDSASPPAQQVQQAVQRSGIWLEAAVAAAPKSPDKSERASERIGADLKNRLLSLVRTATPQSPQSGGTAKGTAPPPIKTPLPPPLPAPFAQGRLRADKPVAEPAPAIREPAAALEAVRQQAEGALARIQLNQAASLPREPGQPATWHLEVPLQLGAQVEVIPMRIEQEPDPNKANGSEGPTFHLTLAMDLAELGEVHARVSVRGDRVNTTFWAVDGDTVTQIENHLPRLAAAFGRAGLKCEQLRCLPGESPPGPMHPTPPLLSERA